MKKFALAALVALLLALTVSSAGASLPPPTYTKTCYTTWSTYLSSGTKVAQISIYQKFNYSGSAITYRWAPYYSSWAASGWKFKSITVSGPTWITYGWRSRSSLTSSVYYGDYTRWATRTIGVDVYGDGSCVHLYGPIT